MPHDEHGHLWDTPGLAGEVLMRLATIRTATGTAAVRIDEQVAVEVGPSDLVELLGDPQWRQRAARATGTEHALDSLDYAPLVGRPDKVVCVGLNYRQHILEMGHDLPDHPTLFAKYRAALIGAHDDIVLPAVSPAMDFEAELGVVIGQRLRYGDPTSAAAAIAGWTVVNDVTARDWQNRTAQWLQGKTFEATTPVGPWLEVAEPPASGATSTAVPSWPLSCTVNGEPMQRADTSDLVFSPVDLVAYVSQVVTLEPGDLIATGTPGGVGHARRPPRYLADGDVVVTRIDGVGELRNTCRAEVLAP